MHIRAVSAQNAKTNRTDWFPARWRGGSWRRRTAEVRFVTGGRKHLHPLITQLKWTGNVSLVPPRSVGLSVATGGAIGIVIVITAPTTISPPPITLPARIRDRIGWCNQQSICVCPRSFIDVTGNCLLPSDPEWYINVIDKVLTNRNFLKKFFSLTKCK